MQIIGFAGYMGSGKSLAASFLRDNAFEVNFADPLKEMFTNIATFHSLYGPSSARLSNIKGSSVSVRVGLQTVGNAMREIDPNFWVDLWAEKVRVIKSKANPAIFRYIVAADVRYPNEVFKIHQLGGCVIRIARPSAAIVNASHDSEAHILDLDVDKVITNDSTPAALKLKVLNFINGGF